MNIVYTFDDGYADITAVSLISLLEQNALVKEINLYIVDCGIHESNRKMLQDLVNKYKRHLTFIAAPPIESLISCDIDCKSWSMVCFIRLFYADLLPDYIETAIHVDCDTLITGSFEKLDHFDMQDNYCAACYDCTPQPMRQMPASSQNQYFSNGLFIMNLKKWREDDIKKEFLKYIELHHDNLPHLDQDVINGAIADKIKLLPANYNVMPLVVMYGGISKSLFHENEKYYTKEELNNAKKSPVMLHITGNKYYSRPWMERSYYPYTKLWRKYAQQLSEPFHYRPEKVKISSARKIKYWLWSKLSGVAGVRRLLFRVDYK